MFASLCRCPPALTNWVALPLPPLPSPFPQRLAGSTQSNRVPSLDQRGWVDGPPQARHGPSLQGTDFLYIYLYLFILYIWGRGGQTWIADPHGGIWVLPVSARTESLPMESSTVHQGPSSPSRHTACLQLPVPGHCACHGNREVGAVQRLAPARGVPPPTTNNRRQAEHGNLQVIWPRGLHQCLVCCSS